MNVLVVLICVFVLIIAVKKYKKYDLEISEKRNEFIEYLYSINDVESLKKIGAINFMGVREDWVPNATSLIPYLEKKIEETGDKNFIEYLNAYQKFLRAFLCTMPFIVSSIVIPLSIIVSF